LKTLLSIGEALIDFIPGQPGRALRDVGSFAPMVGGGPANAAAAFARLGGRASLLTKLGADPFGDKIALALAAAGVDVSHVTRTDAAKTTLAFVSLMADGQREFSFYRSPGADMLYAADEVPREAFADVGALHFSSVSLGDFPMKDAHERAIAYMREAGGIVSFDPNVRQSLWPDRRALRRRILEFLPKAHIVKLSDEDLAFVAGTGTAATEDALPLLFQGDVRLAILTKGAAGAAAYTAGGASADVPSRPAAAIDTTGAGDAFAGAFLFRLLETGAEPESLAALPADRLAELLAFANDYCGYSVQRHGAIASYATAREFAEYRAGVISGRVP
jgi:fructokinase